MDNKRPEMRGFANHFYSEAITGALPLNQNSPQEAPFGLYAEQINGSAFTMSREQNLKTWCYRIQPSVTHRTFKPLNNPTPQQKQFIANPNQLRFHPFDMPQSKTDFIDGLVPIANHSSAQVYLYLFNQPMKDRYFYNADGDFLLVPYQGKLTIHTEFGIIDILPEEIAVIPRGIVFAVKSDSGCGYICENKGAPFILPNLGPIGANGLANPLDFIYPEASFEDKSGDFELIAKYGDVFWQAEIDHSPLNVVAYKGNYLPYQYDLKRFNTINTVSFDHPDPSIFTVLTSPSHTPGMANIDFVIFPERWMVAEDTFRPPYFHRNIMSEFMGLIKGQYDAKAEGFEVGGFSIHNQMSAHGPDSDTFSKASEQKLAPERYQNTLAFMFETNHPWHIEQSLSKV